MISYPLLRNRHFFLLDIVALLVIPAVALTLRLEQANWWPQFGRGLIFFTICGLLAKLPIFFSQGLYRRYWRYANVSDLSRVLSAVALSTAVLAVLFNTAQTPLTPYRLASPRTLPWIDGLLTLLVVGGLRVGYRGLYHWQRWHQGLTTGQRVLIVGAGETGTMAAREMLATPDLDLKPVAFVDDDQGKVGTHIQGLPVAGTISEVDSLVESYQVQRIIIATPSAPPERLREIVDGCKRTGIATQSLPGVYEILAGYKTIKNTPKLNLNQLLRRSQVAIDQTEVESTLNGAMVLITGAGGSIGSEICRQIAHFKPAGLILLGHGENSIFEINLDLRLSFPDLTSYQVIADVRDRYKIDRVVERFRPTVIFHAAAHKHVSLMEANVEEAITNNIMGTQNVLRAAEKYGVERFILISTDKAINPTCIMGATKRVAELLVMVTARRTRHSYMAVRFGNVLGSRGSVIPIFQRQIEAGGPLTITHPDMTRYFMTIPEAAQLVLQASVLGQGGEIFILDMGKQVRILDLARSLIKSAGLVPERDIQLTFTGAGHGEKLREELFLENEEYQRTKHEKIFVATTSNSIDAETLEDAISKLGNLASQLESQAALAQLDAILSEFRSQPPNESLDPVPALHFTPSSSTARI